MSTPTIPSVRFARTPPSGLAGMLGDLIDQNLAREPGRARLLVPAISSIEAVDAGVAVTIELSPDSIVVTEGPDRAATVRIRASSHDLMQLIAVPLRFGLPDGLRAEGRSVIAMLVRGRVRVRGMVRHPRQVARLTTLLSVREDVA